MEMTTSSSAIRASAVISSTASSDLGAPRVAVLVADLPELVAHDLVDARGRGQDVLEVGDQHADLGQLVHDLLPLQAGEALQLQVQHGLGLDLASSPKRLDEAGAGLLRASSTARMSAITSSRWSRAMT